MSMSSFKQLIKTQLTEVFRLFSNPHCYVILLAILSLVILYYGRDMHLSDGFRWFDRMKIFELTYDMHGSLFLIPFAYAAIIFSLRGAVSFWLLSLAVMLPYILRYSLDESSLINNILFALAPLATFTLITLELRWRKNERAIMEKREYERQMYMAQIFKAQEDERRRIAQELHDDTTQDLLLVANRIKAIESARFGECTDEAKEQMEGVRNSIIRISEGVRRISLDLRPSVIDNIGLVPAIRWLADSLQHDTNIKIKFEIEGTDFRLPPENEVMTFRIIQEALNNIRHHSGATEVVILLGFSEETFHIVIRDNGKGFVLPQNDSDLTMKGKLGLVGIKQRVKFLNGALKIHSQPGEGSELVIEVTRARIPIR